MALAMLGTVVLLLTVSACCCQCFAHKTNQRAFARAEASANRRRRRGWSNCKKIVVYFTNVLPLYLYKNVAVNQNGT